jgi:hypothetical protein
MNETNLFIEVRDRDDTELTEVFRQHGVRVRPHYGFQNGPVPDVSELLKHPAPYIVATAAASVLKTAIKAYSDSKKKRFIINRLKTGVKVDATNYSAEELKEMGVLDVGKFENDTSQK